MSLELYTTVCKSGNTYPDKIETQIFKIRMYLPQEFTPTHEIKK